MKKVLFTILIALFLSGCGQIMGGDIAISTHPVVDLLENKTNKAKIKGQEIAKKVSKGQFQRDKYKIEIVDLKKIDKGVEVFARAWLKDEPEYVSEGINNGVAQLRLIEPNQQIGFGKDGTVDIERFVIINPPILVPDPNGDIVQTWEEEQPDGRKIQYERKLREDLQEALLQSLEHTISVKKQKFDDSRIIKGKIGNTTLTAYPAAGSNAPFDGRLLRDGDDSTWATIRGETTANYNSDSETSLNVQLYSTATTDHWARMYRILFGFTTSSIGTDEIDSATFSVYGTNSIDNYSQSVVLDHRIPASNSGTTDTDYNATGWDNSDNATSRITIPSWDTSGYNDFTLNATGESNINKSGYSWYGLRFSGDVDDEEPAWQSQTVAYVSFYTADNSGTTNDPKLVVEHSAAVAEIYGDALIFD